jgi:hypothetical protein
MITSLKNKIYCPVKFNKSTMSFRRISNESKITVNNLEGRINVMITPLFISIYKNIKNIIYEKS